MKKDLIESFDRVVFKSFYYVKEILFRKTVLLEPGWQTLNWQEQVVEN